MKPSRHSLTNSNSAEAFRFALRWWLFIWVSVLLPLDLIYRASALWYALPWHRLAILLSGVVVCLALLCLGIASLSLALSWLLNLWTRRGPAIVKTLNAFTGFLFLLTGLIGYFSYWLEKSFNLDMAISISHWKLSYLYLLIGVLTVLLAITYKRFVLYREIESIARRAFRITMGVVLICTTITSITVVIHQFQRHTAMTIQAAAGEAVPRLPYPNIILVTFDALSAGRTSLYGHIRDTTPNLAALARESYVCNNAFASSNWTLPSLASVITGKHPANHQMKNQYSLFLGESSSQNLPFLLQECGYETALVWSNDYIFPWYNNLQGFKEIRPDSKYLLLPSLRKSFFLSGVGSSRWLEEFLKSQPLLLTAKEAVKPYFKLFVGIPAAARDHVPAPRFLEPREVPEYTFGEAEAILKRGQPPFFLWVHVFPPHAPYLPRDDFLHVFLPEKVLDDPDKLETLYLGGPTQLAQWSSDDIAKLSLRYDEHVHYADHELGNFLEWLKQQGLFDQSILIISSDHGEMINKRFWSHGGPYLYQCLIHVPLVIHLPGQTQGKRLEANVSHVDLAPTILDFLGIEAPPWMDGKSFKKALEDSRFDTGTKFSMNLTLQNALPQLQTTSIAAIHGDYKLIKYLRFNQYEMHDLNRDPGEKNNLIRQEPARFLSLKKEIEGFLAAHSSN